MLKDTLSMSERLACRAVRLARFTYRRLPMAQTPADPDAEMRAWLRTYPPNTQSMGSGGHGPRCGMTSTAM